MVSSSSKNAKRNKRRRSNNSRIGDCTVADLFRFQDQLEFVFGIVYLIASVVHFNLDLIRKCCPKNPPEATLEAIEAYKADVKHLCQQFSTTYKRVLFFIYTPFFLLSLLSHSLKRWKCRLVKNINWIFVWRQDHNDGSKMGNHCNNTFELVKFF